MKRRNLLGIFAALPLVAVPSVAIAKVEPLDPMVTLYREMKATLPPGYRMTFFNHWTQEGGDVFWATARPDDGYPGPELVLRPDAMRWEVDG